MFLRTAALAAFIIVFFVCPKPGLSASLDAKSLQHDIEQITGEFDGRVGACIELGQETACTRATERFSLQSVMKLLVGIAVLYAVDRRGWDLEEKVTVRREDLSLYVQPLAKLVGDKGFETTIGDLVRRAVIHSDSAATDVLVARLGGPEAVQATLNRLNLKEVRLDRDERHLQTEIVGLTWRAEFVDAAVLDKAIAAAPESVREEAYGAYRGDERDTATPRGMASLLSRLFAGNLLSKSSTTFMVKAMEDCVTFPNRLPAGAPAPWKVAHKTGTSSSWKGLTAATNDVGVLTSPDGAQIAVAVFVGDSRATSEERSAIIARIAALAVKHYR